MEDLKKVLIFLNKLNKESKLIFINLLSKKEFKKSEYIAKTGEVSDNFYFLTKGVVRSFITEPNGKEHTRTLFRPVSTTGSLGSLILKEPSTLNYECLTDCELYLGNFSQFKKLTKERIDFANQYNAILEGLFLKMESKIYDLSVLNATERYLKLKKEIPDIENLIAQYHIASYLNITPVQLSRIRKEIIQKRLY